MMPVRIFRRASHARREAIRRDLKVRQIKDHDGRWRYIVSPPWLPLRAIRRQLEGMSYIAKL